jgi:hypothetical protein
MPQKKSFYEQLFNGIGDALADIREKVVEEPWFGRTVTERGEKVQWPEAEVSHSSHEPQCLTGDILPPEPGEAREASSHLRIGYGTVLEGQAERPQWPKAEDVGPCLDHSQDRDYDRDIDR